MTCPTDDFQGHDECGHGGTCYDPSLLSEQALPGEFSCYSNEGYELMEDGCLNGGDTCSPINCGSVSVNNSNQCPSVELFLDVNVLVQCHDGYSLDGKPKRSNFTVTYLKSGERDGEGICAKIVCEEALHVDHAVSDVSSVVFGESITWMCDEGYAQKLVKVSFL